MTSVWIFAYSVQLSAVSFSDFLLTGGGRGVYHKKDSVTFIVWQLDWLRWFDRTPLRPPMFHSFRRYHSIDIYSFLADLQCSRLITNPPKSLGCLLIAYNTTLSSLLDKHAPVITRFSSRKSKSNTSFTSTLRAFKSTVRHAEKHLEMQPLRFWLVHSQISS